MSMRNFGAMDFDALIGKDLTSKIDMAGGSINKLNSGFNDMAKSVNKIGAPMKKFMGIIGGSKQTKKLKKTQDSLKGVFGALGMLGGFGLDALGIFLQFADSLGILQPILDLVNTLFSVIGMSAMEVFMPALKNLYEVLFSESSMKLWKKLGAIIGDFLNYVISGLVSVFSNPLMIAMILMFVKAFMGIFKFVAGVLGGFLSWAAAQDPSTIMKLFIILASGIAFLVGLMSGGPFGVILGGILAVATAAILTAAFMSAMAFGEGGIVTRPTFALIGEKGPEAVIPLNQINEVGGNNDEMLWATQDNGDKLDRIYIALSGKGRLI